MNRYENLKDYFFMQIDEKCHGMYKQRALLHSIQVSTLCQKLALEKHLNVELAGIMGLFHDYIQFTQHSSFQHGVRCKEWIENILDDFSQEEKQIIQQAIGHHSEKDKLHDLYSEILKDADVLAQYFAEMDMVLSDTNQKRIKKYLPDDSI
ncbi:HD domain-containing protein [Allocoprobacillus halotolerans]|uniref:HD domain-containing protein n=1 Tax=Allocoprobacillus halotolerans TaxID=2944914 RepID=A0ABY5I290_9FIRM|nr:HD domain-containing protein [Allocoprobacillus halotolerans]UTY38489.1 HD domain-containing protein [Allocoprobacillus halotolerans]